MEQLHTELIPPLQAATYQQEEEEEEMEDQSKWSCREEKNAGKEEGKCKRERTGSLDLNYSHLHKLSALTGGGGQGGN